MKADSALIVALDVSDTSQAEALVNQLGDAVDIYKVGYQLAYGGGLSFGRELIEAGKQVFFDLKLLDIDNTVAKGVEQIANMGASMLTVHAYPNAMNAAVEAAKGSDLCLLAVTVLTSMDDAQLDAAGYRQNSNELVSLRVSQARQAGMGGIVCSAQEAAATRKVVGADMAIVTPGIRPGGASLDDQKRIATPQFATRQGASHLVIGRPVTKSVDPRQAALQILAEMRA